jgi:hypothetical protein
LFDGDAVDIDDHVLGAQPPGRRRASRNDLDDLYPVFTPQLPSATRRQGTASAGDADIGAPEATVLHQCGDDPASRVVDRHGKAESDPRHRRVDADHPAGRITQRATGVAGVQGCVGLDHVLDDAHRAGGARRERPTKGADDAGRHRTGETHRVSDRDDELTDPEVVGVAELGGSEITVGRSHDRQVR